MRKEHIKYLACPKCGGDLNIKSIETEKEEKIKNGQLICVSCNSFFSIMNYIPRFTPIKNYAASFGLEWIKHARTQYDSYTKTKISEKRFFKTTKWPRLMKEEIILEVGGGSGRFTEVAALTNAMVVSVDYSYAVESNYKSNGHKKNVLIVQGDLNSMPFKRHYFDKLFCFGVLQHTPNVKKSFLSLIEFLKPEGKLSIDIYRKPILFSTRHIVRPLAKKLNHAFLYKLCKNYTNFMWPIARIINRLPKGNIINRLLLIADYRRIYELPDKILKEWAILDIFDALSPTYENSQKLETIKSWFNEAGLIDVEVYDAHNSLIIGRGTMPNNPKITKIN